jgi:hypothetical protein
MMSAILATALPSAGCSMLAAAVFAFTPPEKVPAQFTLSPGKVAIMLDDRFAPVPFPSAKEQLVNLIQQDLISHEAAGEVTDYDDMLHARTSQQRTQQRMFERMTAKRMGELLEADQVLWLEVTDFSLKDRRGDSIYRPRMTIELRVVDTDSGSVLWPTTGRHTIKKKLGIVVAHDDYRRAPELTEQLGQEFAPEISKLFYKYTREFVDHRRQHYQGPV